MKHAFGQDLQSEEFLKKNSFMQGLTELIQLRKKEVRLEECSCTLVIVAGSILGTLSNVCLIL
jgi:hypothetical protein